MKDYIAWAISKGYAVIDVNIPKHATMEPVRCLLFMTCDGLLTPNSHLGSMRTKARIDLPPPRSWLDICGTITSSKWL